MIILIFKTNFALINIRMKNKTDNKFTSFKVKDILLADWGRKEIKLAEGEFDLNEYEIEIVRFYALSNFSKQELVLLEHFH